MNELKLTITLLIYIVGFSACVTNRITESESALYTEGESLVLGDTIPGKLCFVALSKDNIVVRSSYQANNINHPNDFGHCLYLQAFEAMFF